MDYEKKYNEIVGQIKKAYLYVQTDSTKAVLEEIFPELSESEDEKVRKEIVRFIQMEVEDEIVGNKWLAWLGKQGEPMEINPTEFDTRLQTLIGKFDNLPKEELIGSLIFWLNVVQNDGTYKNEEKQGEQKSQRMISAEAKEAMYDKPAWSEKDEQHIDSLLKRLDGLCRNEFERTRFAINEDEDWLKSLKQRIGG